MAEEEKKTINLTDADTKILLSIMKNLTGDIPFDANAVAEECGYKSAKTVKDVWNRLKKAKLGVTTTASPAKKATSGKKRKGVENGSDGLDDGDDAVAPTPTKKARTSKAKESAVKEEGDGEEE